MSYVPYSVEPEWFLTINSDINSGNLVQANQKFEALRAHVKIDANVANLFGLLATRLNQSLLAEQLYRAGIGLDPRYVSLYTNLGNLLAQAGNLEQAVEVYRTGMQQAGHQVELFINLGLTLNYLGRTDEAIHALKNAINLNPNFIEAHLNLGLVYMAQGRYIDSTNSFQAALRLRHDYAAAYNGLGLVGHNQGLVTKAEESYRKALQYSNNDYQGQINLANILLESGKQAEAISILKNLVQSQSSKPDAVSNFLMALQYDVNTSPGEILEWAKKLNPPANHVHVFNQSLQRARFLAVDKPIIGFVSADFKAHPVGWFLKAILPKLREKYHVYAYANQSNCDFLTQEIISGVDRWNVILGISDDSLANKIRDDRVDILVDLSGHTSGNRLGIFSLRAAPIQVSWLGYFSTTGVSEMDYVFMDEEHVPDKLEKFFSEKVMRINPIRLCYSPPVYAPEVSELPLKFNGYLTFGSFNNSSKLNDFTIRMWSKILKDVPNSRLILKWRTFADFGMRSRVRDDFQKYGIEPGRLQFSQSSSHDIMLAEYSEIDVALDPYPFTGATTTCEAMWMGVPVITLRGDKPVSRQSSAMLKAVGLENLIADSVDQYIQIAKDLAGDIVRLSQIRGDLRLKLKESYLCEPGKFTDGLLTAFEKVIFNYTKCE